MRLLLVEDDAGLATELQRLLVKAGYRVCVAGTGEQALEAAFAEPFDIAILDLGLPDRPGMQVLAEWRRASLDLPVLILTARDRWQDKVDGLQSGADDYLVKPFHSAELLARLATILKRSGSGPSAGERIGEWLLDEGTQSLVDRSGQTQALTAMEFRLLRYLWVHAGQVVDRWTLQEHLYAEDTDPASNVVEVYLSRVRKRLGPGYIETRRGQGYRLRQPDSPERA